MMTGTTPHRPSGCYGDLPCAVQVDSGRQWYLHAIYTVRSAENAGRGIGKRSVDSDHSDDDRYLHTVLSAPAAHSADLPQSPGRARRDASDAEGVGKRGKGTNMARVQLNLAVNDGGVDIGTNVTTSSDVPLIPILVSIIVSILIVGLLLLAFFLLRRRKRQTPPPSPAQTITVVTNGKSRVYTAQSYSNDNTEV